MTLAITEVTVFGISSLSPLCQLLASAPLLPLSWGICLGDLPCPKGQSCV